MSGAQGSAASVRDIVQSAEAGSLGTLTPESAPFVSLVTVAAADPTRVTMLLSGLAKHTQHLAANPACSLLLVQPGGEDGDPLAGARVTLTGRAQCLPRGDDRDARKEFLYRHPGASMYVDFGDFAFYQLVVAEAHLVGGFGRIETLTADQI